MSGSSRRTRAAPPWLPAACLAGLLAACGGAAGPTRAPAGESANDPLLVVDGITITFGELAADVAWLDACSPEYSRRAKLRRVLDELIVPLRFAQREFGAERAQLLEQARGLRAVAGNVVELERAAAQRRHLRKDLNPNQVEIPIARFLFDPLRTRSVSEPIELPQGFVVAAAFDLQQGGTAVADRCDALQVPFYTHDPAAWKDWLLALQRRLSDKVTWVHPDYRDAIPDWLQLP